MQRFRKFLVNEKEKLNFLQTIFKGGKHQTKDTAIALAAKQELLDDIIHEFDRIVKDESDAVDTA